MFGASSGSVQVALPTLAQVASASMIAFVGLLSPQVCPVAAPQLQLQLAGVDWSWLVPWKSALGKSLPQVGSVLGSPSKSAKGPLQPEGIAGTHTRAAAQFGSEQSLEQVALPLEPLLPLPEPLPDDDDALDDELLLLLDDEDDALDDELLLLELLDDEDDDDALLPLVDAALDDDVPVAVAPLVLDDELPALEPPQAVRPRIVTAAISEEVVRMVAA